MIGNLYYYKSAYVRGLYLIWLATSSHLLFYFHVFQEMRVGCWRICQILCCSLLKNEAFLSRARWAVYSEIIYSVYDRKAKNTKHLIAFLIYKSDSSKGYYSFILLVLEMLLWNRLSGRIHSDTRFVGYENAERIKLSFLNALQQPKKGPFYLSRNTAFCLSEVTHTHTYLT